MVSWLHGSGSEVRQKIMVEGPGRGKLLSSWQLPPQRRRQGRFTALTATAAKGAVKRGTALTGSGGVGQWACSQRLLLSHLQRFTVTLESTHVIRAPSSFA